ncbi:WYL domain-containing protein [Staphylococcus epidermidis]|nr:WYL domain-containing protein [Staphylococcus epidermidis]
MDRIESLTVTDETFEQPEDFSVDSYFMVNLLPIMENDIIFSFRNISEIVVVITFCDFNKKTK